MGAGRQCDKKNLLHRKKKIREFPVSSRDVTTKLSHGGKKDVITEMFLPRGSLASDIPAGDGKLVNLFYGVHCPKWGSPNGSISRARNPLPLALVMYLPASKALRTGPYKS